MSKKLIYTLLIIGTIATYMLAIEPLYTGTGGIIQPEHSVQELTTLNAQYDAALGRADELLNEAQSLRSDYSRISDDDKTKMAIMLPDSVDKVRLLSEALKIGADAGFNLTDLTYSEGGATSDGRGTASISFSVNTTYDQFKRLINNFEKSMRLYSVDSVSFTAPDKTGMSMYQVKLNTYYLP